jgi:hypothetical protein
VVANYEELEMTASRVMTSIFVRDSNDPFDRTDWEWMMVVWDWETGDLVRKLWSWPHFSHVTFPGI